MRVAGRVVCVQRGVCQGRSVCVCAARRACRLLCGVRGVCSGEWGVCGAAVAFPLPPARPIPLRPEGGASLCSVPCVHPQVTGKGPSSLHQIALLLMMMLTADLRNTLCCALPPPNYPPRHAPCGAAAMGFGLPWPNRACAAPAPPPQLLRHPLHRRPGPRAQPYPAPAPPPPPTLGPRSRAAPSSPRPSSSPAPPSFPPSLHALGRPRPKQHPLYCRRIR